MKLLQSGNSKLHNQYMFNLPASEDICGRSICKGCYAHREQLRYPSVTTARTSRYTAALSDDFVSTIVKEVQSIKKPFVAIRVHASGEFFSQSYIDKWVSIAKQLPHVTFYAFTKRLTDFDFSILSSLPNFVLINSLHFGKLNYDKLPNLDQSAPICPATLNKSTQCGISCTYCMNKPAQYNGIQFVKH